MLKIRVFYTLVIALLFGGVALYGQSECGCFGPNTVSIDAGTGMTPEQLGLPANWFSPNPDPVPSCISISGHLIIPNDWFQNFAGVDEIVMQPGASIEIMGHWQKEHAGHLRFSGNNVHGCNQMWRGITVNGGAHLQLINSTIADAQSAASFLFNGAIGNAHLDNCHDMLFLNNHIGLDDNPSNGAYGYFFVSEPIHDTEFRSEGDLLPSFDNLPFYNSEASFAGIFLRNNGYFALTQQGIVFDGLRNAVIANGSNVTLNNLLIENIRSFYPAFPTSYNYAGTGINAYACFLSVNNCDISSPFKNEVVGIQSKFSKKFDINWNSISTYTGLVELSTQSESLNIASNEIDYVFTSCYVSNASNSNVQILNNTFTNHPSSNFSVGLWIWGDFNASAFGRRVVNNNIFNITGGAYGVYFQNQSNCEAKYNSFTLAQDAEGINLNNSASGVIYGNNINGSGVAIEVDLSDASTVCCNELDGHSGNGTLQVQLSPNTNVRHNTLTGYGLGLQVYGVLGIQANDARNFYDNMTAMHLGNELEVANSKFFEDEGFMDPVLGVVFPVYSLPNISNPDFQWFYDSPNPQNLTCESDPLCSSFKKPSELSSYAFQAISDGFATAQYGDFENWNGKQMAFSFLKKNPSQVGVSSVVDGFYENALNGNISKLYDIDLGIQEMFNTSPSQEEIISNADNAIKSIMLEFENIDNQLMDKGLSHAQYDALLDQKEALYGEILVPTKALDVALKADYLDRVSNATTISQNNSKIVGSTIFEKNEKAVNDIYLNTIAQGVYHLTDEQFGVVTQIAEQCVYEGGKAVIEARCLYALNEPRSFDDMDICNLDLTYDDSESYDERDDAKNLYFTLQPNPTNSRITVGWDTEQFDGKSIRMNVSKSVGKIARTYSFDGNLGRSVMELNLEPGIYTVSFYVNKQYRESQTIVIIK